MQKCVFHAIHFWNQVILCMAYCFWLHCNITKLKTAGFVLFCLFVCSKSFVGDLNGTVFTPNWPLKYPRDTSCQWSLNLHRAKTARFFFTFLDLEYNFVCKTDPGKLDTDDISISGEWWEKFTSISYKLDFFFSKKLSWKQGCGQFARIFDKVCVAVLSHLHTFWWVNIRQWRRL